MNRRQAPSCTFTQEQGFAPRPAPVLLHGNDAPVRKHEATHVERIRPPMLGHPRARNAVASPAGIGSRNLDADEIRPQSPPCCGPHDLLDPLLGRWDHRTAKHRRGMQRHGPIKRRRHDERLNGPTPCEAPAQRRPVRDKTVRTHGTRAEAASLLLSQRHHRVRPRPACRRNRTFP